MNLYAYVGNDPLNNVDPSGLWTLQVGVTISGGFLGFGGAGVSFGFAADTNAGIGLYGTTFGGFAIGASAKAGISAAITNANSISDLQGPALAQSFAITTEGGVASADFSESHGPNGTVINSYGGTLGFGGGTPAGYLSGGSVTGAVVISPGFASLSSASTTPAANSNSPASPASVSQSVVGPGGASNASAWGEMK